MVFKFYGSKVVPDVITQILAGYIRLDVGNFLLGTELFFVPIDDTLGLFLAVGDIFISFVYALPK